MADSRAQLELDKLALCRLADDGCPNSADGVDGEDTPSGCDESDSPNSMNSDIICNACTNVKDESVPGLKDEPTPEILLMAIVLFATIKRLLVQAKRVVIFPSGFRVLPFSDRYCKKGSMPTRRLSFARLVQLLTRFLRALGQRNGLVLDQGPGHLAYGILHSGHAICSAQELEAHYEGWQTLARRIFPSLGSNDLDDLSHDSIAKILDDLAKDRVVVEYPNAYFAQTCRHLLANRGRRNAIDQKYRQHAEREAKAKVGKVHQFLEILEELKTAVRTADMATIKRYREELTLIDADGTLFALQDDLKVILPDGLFAFYLAFKDDALRHGEPNATRTAQNLGFSGSTGTVYKMRIRDLVDREIEKEEAA